MTRQAVSKHLAILEDANLVATVRRGREKLHYLNPVPIHEIGGALDRQIRTLSLAGVERHEEERWKRVKETDDEQAARSSTSPTSAPRRRKVWAALTDPQTITRNTGSASRPNATGKPARRGALKFEDGRTADTGEILESDPPQRLVIRLA